MRKVFGVLCALSFFYTIGAIGNIDRNAVAYGTGMIRATIGLGLFAIFALLAGAFKGVSNE